MSVKKTRNNPAVLKKRSRVKKANKIRNNPAALKKRSRVYNPHILAKKIKDRIRYIGEKICQEGANVSYSNKITFYIKLNKIVEIAKSSDLTLFENIYNILEAEKEKNKSLNAEIEKLRSELEQRKRQYEEDLKRIYDAHQITMEDQLNELNDLRNEKNNLLTENNLLENWIAVLEIGIRLLQETTGVRIMNID
ncbi:27121_t:CDS:2 [Gigaspora margarita]|uniref:27121_t:CDS:1 n=1 Tax=Gigaspora margarita TaxID=4874 RepID=A0ABN7UR08_GIGMA|nr:27121_t:CDS:2 [Gigaspora margarita]